MGLGRSSLLCQVVFGAVNQRTFPSFSFHVVISFRILPRVGTPHTLLNADDDNEGCGGGGGGGDDDHYSIRQNVENGIFQKIHIIQVIWKRGNLF